MRAYFLYNGNTYTGKTTSLYSRVSCQKGPTRHAYAWQIGPFGRISSYWGHPLVSPTGTRLASALVYLTPDSNGTVPSGQCGHEFWTCRGRCQEPQQSYTFSMFMRGITNCQCDNLCLYLGDCCYDYLHECKLQNYTLENGIKKQARIAVHWKPYVQCVVVNIKAAIHGDFTAYEETTIAMVATCPSSADEHHIRLCNQSSSLANVWARTPVHWRGLLFRNIFCAACHDAPPAEVEWTRAQVICNDSVPYWEQNEGCSQIRLAGDDVVDMTRLYNHCALQKCDEKAKPVDSCPDDDPHAEECMAYRATVYVELYNFLNEYQNEACQRCDPNPISTEPLRCHPEAVTCRFTNIYIHHELWMNFFDFTGKYTSLR